MTEQLKQEKTAIVKGYVKFAETKQGQKGPYRHIRVAFGKAEETEWVTIRVPMELLEKANVPDPEKGDFIAVTGLLTVFGEPGEAYIFAQSIENFVMAKDIPDNRPAQAAASAPEPKAPSRGYSRGQSQGASRPAPAGNNNSSSVYSRGRSSGYSRDRH